MNSNTDLKQELHEVKELIKNFNNNVVRALVLQQKAMNKLFERQLEELKACREAFQQNVERDEDLIDALHESNDSWDGC